MLGKLALHKKLILGSGFALLAAACSSSVAGSKPGATQDPGTTDPQMTATDPGDSGGPTTCDLKASGLAYSRLDCEECMQNDCCAQTVACFSNNAECKALYTCVDACPSRGVTTGAG